MHSYAEGIPWEGAELEHFTFSFLIKKYQFVDLVWKGKVQALQLLGDPSWITELWRVNAVVNLFSWHIIFRDTSATFSHPLITYVSEVSNLRCD